MRKYIIELYNCTKNTTVEEFEVREVESAVFGLNCLNNNETDDYSLILQEVVNDDWDHIFESSDGNKFVEALKDKHILRR